MRSILIILLFVSTIGYSQDLQSFLSIASFNLDEGPFLETYLSFNANTLILKQENNKYYGEIDVVMKIYSNNLTVFQDHYLLKSPVFDSINNHIFFIDQQRIPLKNGEYSIEVKVSDLHHEYEQTHLIEFEIDYKKTSISDIQLIDNYVVASNESILNKSGYSLSPAISNFYPPLVNSLIYYFEVYNTHLLNSNKYLINTYIESYETNTPLYNFNKMIRKLSSEVESNLLEFNIEQLPTGNYNLVCEIKDVENISISIKKIFFQRSNSSTVNINYHDLISIDIYNTFVSNISVKDSLKQFIDYLYPISSPLETSFAQNQLRYDDIGLMQKFFYNFWRNRNRSNPASAWLDYHREVKKVNKEFKNFKIKGYLTDRGRVYLQYGPPNSRNKVENASATYPYEIWHYYKLKNQVNKKFVFINSDFATNEYRLEYSNVYGEVSNSEWRDKIEYDENPTFGDDFNNNYINPR